MALWGGRFSQDPQADVARLSESISFDKRLYRHDIMGSKAHVAMLAKQGIIPEATALAIRAELDEICKRIEAGDFKYDIAMEDIHMHIESALIGKLGAEGARVHSARSRNDHKGFVKEGAGAGGAMYTALALGNSVERLRKKIEKVLTN